MQKKVTRFIVFCSYFKRHAHNKVIQGFLFQPQSCRDVGPQAELSICAMQGIDLRQNVRFYINVQPAAITDDRLEASDIRIVRVRLQARMQ